MFTEIDKILYPTRCEVIHVASQRFVFPIFKNGSSSLREEAKKNKWRILINEQIKKCDLIEIYLRDPVERMISGAGAYYDDMMDPKLGLNESTVIYFMNHYHYLNRHYLPQIQWLISLGRYLQNDTILQLKDLSQLSDIINTKKDSNRTSNPSKYHSMPTMPTSEFYIELDQYLYGLIGTNVTLREILTNMCKEHSQAYNYVFGYAKRLTDVLP